MSGIRYVDHLDTDPSAKTSFQDYTLFDSKISYQVRKYAELFINAENIFNQKYENNMYYTMPGITAFGGVKMKF